MKKTHIILIVLLAVAVGTIMSMVSDSSTYASFKEAFENPSREFHVVGVLNKQKEMKYDPLVNANLFSFYMIDKDGKECKILFRGTKPQDFERSEQIVITGLYDGKEFIASKILMKCPSKYNEGGADGFKEVTATEISSL